jgi:hypothetical protein
MDRSFAAGSRLLARVVGTLALIGVFYASGCGDSAPPPISVALTPNTTQTLDQGKTVAITATAANDSKGVTWGLTGAGALSAQTATTVTYTAPASVTTASTATVTATSVSDTTKNASLTINLVPPPSITLPTLPDGVVGTPYTTTVLAVTGGVAPYTWSLTSAASTFPTGMTLGADGTISGTPTAKGTFNFTVVVTDSQSVASAAANLSIKITPAPLAITTTSPLPTGTVNSSYSTTLQASGGTTPYTWSKTAGALPAGLTLTATGLISGFPTTSGTSTFTVKVTDSGLPTAQTKSQQLSILVNPTLSISTASLPNGMVQTAYSQTLQSGGGTAPVTWSLTIGTLPPGLNLSTAGVISGTPTTAGTSNFTVRAADSSTPQQSAPKALSIKVDPATLVITTTTLPNATVNTAYNTTLQTTGGTTPVTWAVTVGSLPGWASLNPNTGVISGTPTTTAAAVNFTVQATDSGTPAAQVKTQALSITVDPAVAACGSGSESLLKGQYAMALRGFDASGPVGIGATFDADGMGHVAQLVGVEDINSTSIAGVQKNLAITSASSSYSVGSDHRGCLTITTSAGTQKFRFSLSAISGVPAVASSGHIIEFDATGSNTAGVLRKQDLTAFLTSSISGNFAFGASGPKIGGGKFAAAGILSLNGGGAINNTSVIDFNDNGNMNATGTATYPTNPVPVNSGGTYSISVSGRGSMSYTPSGGPAIGVIVYVVSSSELLTLSSDAQATNPLTVGSLLKQTASSFTASSLNAPMIFYTTGLSNSGGTTVSRVLAGILTVPSSTTVSFSGQQNSGGTVKAQSATGITYTVALNGRVTFVGGGGGGNPIVYLVSANSGFVLFADGSLTNVHVASGFVEPQTGGPFSTSSASGTYAFGTIQPDEASISLEAGFATFVNPSVSGKSDKNASGTLKTSTFGPNNYDVDNTGLGRVPAGCNINGTNGTDGTCGTIFYIISPTRAVVLDASASTTPTHPQLEVAEQ